MTTQFKDIFSKARMDVSRGMKRTDLSKSAIFSDSRQDAMLESIR